MRAPRAAQADPSRGGAGPGACAWPPTSPRPPAGRGRARPSTHTWLSGALGHQADTWQRDLASTCHRHEGRGPRARPFRPLSIHSLAFSFSIFLPASPPLPCANPAFLPPRFPISLLSLGDQTEQVAAQPKFQRSLAIAVMLCKADGKAATASC